MQGSLMISVFRVPRKLVPHAHLPSGARMITLAGNAFVAVAFVSYEPGSELTYEELLVAAPVWDEGRVAVSVPQIWVDSEASRRGGRELWGIPKQLARFSEGSSIAAVAVTGGVPLPGRWTVGATRVLWRGAGDYLTAPMAPTVTSGTVPPVTTLLCDVVEALLVGPHSVVISSWVMGRAWATYW